MSKPRLQRAQKSPQAVSGSIKAVAIYEIIKGLGAICVAIALSVWHTQLLGWIDVTNQLWTAQFGTLFVTQVDGLVRTAQKATESWQVFMLLILGYAAIRFIEAYGLWWDKTWAYWLSVLGYGLLIPVEIYYLIVRPFDWINLSTLIVNIIVVGIVYRHMRKKGLV